jgi:hypothetical protein
LGDAVAHGRYAAGDLRCGADGIGGLLDEVGIGRIRLMGAQHVVIGRNDAEVQRLGAGELGLVGWGAGGKTVGEVAAGQRRAVDAFLPLRLEAIEIIPARLGTPSRDAVGDVLNGLADRHVQTPSEAARRITGTRIR